MHLSWDVPIIFTPLHSNKMCKNAVSRGWVVDSSSVNLSEFYLEKDHVIVLISSSLSDKELRPTKIYFWRSVCSIHYILYWYNVYKHNKAHVSKN